MFTNDKVLDIATVINVNDIHLKMDCPLIRMRCLFLSKESIKHIVPNVIIPIVPRNCKTSITYLRRRTSLLIS